MAFLLSLWGAVLSSFLAILKISESWNNRFQIRVTWILRGSEEMGHDISIQNLSSKPVLLESMEIFSTKGIGWFGRESYIWTPEDSWLNARIQPSDTKVYNFSEGDYFGWSRKKVKVRLYFAGRKPITRKIG